MLCAAAAPVMILLFYFYIRDKYEKEPLPLLAWGLLCGIYATFVIYGVGLWLEYLFVHQETPLYTAFISASLVEEGIKLLFMYSLIAHNPHCNEPFDCVVYGVFVSLGFACIENMVYVTDPYWGGWGTAISRAVVSVPGHGMFGVQMGYYLAKWRFWGKKIGIFASFAAAWICHGLYDYFLLVQWQGAEICFWLSFLFLILASHCQIRYLLRYSPFRHRSKENTKKRYHEKG